EQVARCFRLALAMHPHGKGEVPLAQAQVALPGYFEVCAPAIEAGGSAALSIRPGSVEVRAVVGGVVPIAGMVADITGQRPVRDQPFVAAWLALAVPGRQTLFRHRGGLPVDVTRPGQPAERQQDENAEEERSPPARPLPRKPHPGLLALHVRTPYVFL